MSNYCIVRSIDASFEDVVRRTKSALADEGFGVLSEIDVAATLKKKLDVDMGSYVILGACHPPSAHEALQAEPRIGTMLPCNVVVRAIDGPSVEVAAIDPVASMSAVDNPAVRQVADRIQQALRRVVAAT